MAGYVLAFDQGTTSSRAIIFNDKAELVHMAQQPINLSTPKSGYVEQDAMQIWHTQISCAHNAILQAGLLATDISSIAITNQRETTVLWHKKTGLPVAPAIVWQDRRTKAWCDEQHSRLQNQQQHHIMADFDLQKMTGLRLDPYFSASKIFWLLQQYPKLRQQALAGELAFGTIDSWLVFKLTGGEHVIDVTNASRTLLLDINSLQWSDTLLKQFDIPASLLPTVLPSDGDFGKTKTGLFAKQIPIKAVLGDQQAALFGQGCTQAGMAKNTYGTGCFMLMNTGYEPQFSQHQLLTTVAWQRRGQLSAMANAPSVGGDAALISSNTHNNNSLSALDRLINVGKSASKTVSRHGLIKPSRHTSYALEGSVFMAGAIIQWLRDNLGIIDNSEAVETLARQVDSSEEVVLLPAFTGLGAPYWCPDAKASISGMTRGTTKAHIARAALEAIAFQTYDVLIAMQKDAPTSLTELRVDGGAANNDLLMQFQADLLQVPVLRPVVTEVTAKGAALLAGIASGLYDERIITESWRLQKAFEPKMDTASREHHLQKWQTAITKSITSNQDSH
ncbi:FGGY family carbohydrate kinase [Psychrobacter sp. I-STPA10]|uniref:FGGY family carbohydrate kinase n=1 Tax=Psychrobacter sp. I-STPA10 TaxID=2585769 RepID=UPI001E31437B|nr:glycerol kinase [Psychrobacter sp. I-STPA10]